jgi:hypothetical protein
VSSSDDDKTPTLRPVANPAHRGIVRALSNHVIVLDRVRGSTQEVCDLMQQSAGGVVPEQFEALGKAMRAESDSAVAVAQQAEALAVAARKERIT